MDNIDAALWVSVIGIVVGVALAIPLAVAANLLTPRVGSYLEKRKLIRAGKTRKQALLEYNRIRAFREGRKDKYAHYFVLAGFSVLFASLFSSFIVIAALGTSGDLVKTIILFVALILAAFGGGLLGMIARTARQLERFDDYKKEFEERWGPLTTDDLKDG